MSKGDGFTIIEVTIFLAISGMLLLMVFLGSGGMARQSRFSDTVNSFQAYLQQQYELVQNGVNMRDPASTACSGPSTLPGTDSCLLIGRVVSFTVASSFSGTARTVYTAQTSITDTLPPYSQLALTLPVVTSQSEQAYELPWGARIQMASRDSARTAAAHPIKDAAPATERAVINSIAFMRSPNSPQIYSYYFYSPTPLTAANVQIGLRLAIADSAKASLTTTAVCIENTNDWTSGSPVAAIMLGEGRGSAGISTNYTPSRGAGMQCNN